MTEFLKQCEDAVLQGDRDRAVALANDALEGQFDILEIIENGFSPGIRRAGELWEQGEYFLPELAFSAESMKAAMDVLQPALLNDDAETGSTGVVIIGTVQGDIHDIGKNIVSFMLEFNNFEVIDIGVDVPPQKFVEAVKEHEPQVVGLCGLLTLAYDPMKDTVAALADAGLRDKVKIMVGGGAIDDQIREYAGADAYGENAVAAVNLAKQWT